MARRAPLEVPSDLEKSAHSFLYYREEEARAKAKKEAARNQLKGWAILKDAAGRFVNCEEDENGNRILPFEINGKKIVAQKSTPAAYIDMDETERLLREKDPTGRLYDLVFKRKVIREFAEDELFLLNQQGVISDDELDALEVQSEPSYSLVVRDA